MLCFAVAHVQATEDAGVPGSPAATRSIDGQVLPPFALPFGGESKLLFTTVRGTY